VETKDSPMGEVSKRGFSDPFFPQYEEEKRGWVISERLLTDFGAEPTRSVSEILGEDSTFGFERPCFNL